MQKLSLDEEEKVSRKAYLKNKKKQDGIVNPKRRKKIIIIGIVTLLAVYVFVQFYIYYKENNYVYSQDENVDNQKVYDLYYLSEGYMYDPVTSLYSTKSNSFEDKMIFKDLAFTDIRIDGNYIYGIKGNSLYQLDLTTNQVSLLKEKEVTKFTNYKQDIYFIAGANKAAYHINTQTKQIQDLKISGVTEILVDDVSLYLCVEKEDKKKLVRMTRADLSTADMTKNENVSYIIQDEKNIYFVNKTDGNKIYLIHKDGTGVTKLVDKKMLSDTGNIKDIDGSKYFFTLNNILYYINADDSQNLWGYHLVNKTNEKVLHTPIETLLSHENVVMYKQKGERGLYLYNLDTKFSSQISPRLITEFMVNKVGE